MTIKKYLNSIYRQSEIIKADLQELESLRKLSTAISSPNLSGMPSGSHDQEPPFAKAVVKIVDLQKKINDEIAEYTTAREVIRSQINKLGAIDNISYKKLNDYKLVLQLRYLCFDKWETIAEKMNYTLQWVLTLHKRALKYFEKYYKDKTE